MYKNDKVIRFFSELLGGSPVANAVIARPNIISSLQGFVFVVLVRSPEI